MILIAWKFVWANIKQVLMYLTNVMATAAAWASLHLSQFSQCLSNKFTSLQGLHELVWVTILQFPTLILHKRHLCSINNEFQPHTQDSREMKANISIYDIIKLLSTDLLTCGVFQLSTKLWKCFRKLSRRFQSSAENSSVIRKLFYGLHWKLIARRLATINVIV